MYYSILHRYGTSWDDQVLVYTKSKALFDTLCLTEENITYPKFSEELKQDIKDACILLGIPEPSTINQQMYVDIWEAMSTEYLGCIVEYPIVVLNHTEYVSDW